MNILRALQTRDEVMFNCDFIDTFNKRIIREGQFARVYKPEDHPGKYILAILGDLKPIRNVPAFILELVEEAIS